MTKITDILKKIKDHLTTQVTTTKGLVYLVYVIIILDTILDFLGK